MNISVYLFGEFNSGYSQYPDDYASAIFQKFSANAKSVTQIAIHRDGNLMYYGYIRKLQHNKFIGLCVVLNGMILARVEGLFSLFENVISNLVIQGKLIHFTEQGDLVTSVDKLYTNGEEIELLTESLRAGFNRFESCCLSLPVVCYGTAKDSSRDFVVDDEPEDIFRSSYTNGYTYVYKSKGFNTSLLNSYKGVLCKSNKEKQELQAKLDALEKEHAKTLKQKKQYKFVFVLFVILLGCAMGLFLLNDSLNDTRNKLLDANNTIGIQIDSLSSKNNEITTLYRENNQLEQERQAEEEKRIEVENSLEELKRKICDRQPFIVKSTTFDFRSGYLRFYYYGMMDGYVNVKVRVYGDDGTSYLNNSTIYIESGDNSADIFINRGLNAGKWYSFELLKDNVILGGDRHYGLCFD